MMMLDDGQLILIMMYPVHQVWLASQRRMIVLTVTHAIGIADTHPIQPTDL